MSLPLKKSILIKYFRSHGGMPKGWVTIDYDDCDMGNVSVNGEYYGTFDYVKQEFIEIA